MAARARSSPSTAATIAALMRLVVPVAVMAFVFAFLADAGYVATSALSYANAAAWLVVIGLFATGLVVLLLAVALFGGWFVRPARWLSAMLFGAAFVTGLFDVLIHNRDGAATVLPSGIWLSAITAILLLAAGWLARDPVGGRR